MASPHLRRVLLVGSQTADRTLGLLALLTSCVARHGWSERIEILVAGLGRADGAASQDLRAALEAAGLEEPAVRGIALESSAARLQLADLVIADTTQAADRILTYDESEGKQVWALTELVEEAADVLDGDHADAAEFLARLAPLMPEVLRRIVSS